MKSIATLKVRYWNAVVLLFLILFSLPSFAQDPVPEPEPEPTGPRVETDKPDYQPGDYVTITGSGWQPGETVSLDFDEVPKPATCLLPHDMVAVADEFGNIYNNQFLIKLNHLGVTFTLTATGQSSGLTAQTIFTDDIQLWSNPITGSNPNTANPYTSGQTVASFITVSGIGRGSGISGQNGSNRYNADGWTTNNSLNSSDYFYFSLTPNAGYHLRFSNFVYTGQASGSGPDDFAFRSNANGDNFSSNIGSPDENGESISLTASQFQNKTTATEFRLYGYNSGGSNGTFSVDSFVFNGLVLGTTVTSLSGFATCNNATSAAQSFVVNGLGLTPNSTITITPSANFELSTTSAVTGFQGGGNVTLTASALGAVSGTVWVRIKTGAAVGALSETINVSGGGFVSGDNVNVSVSGTVTQIPTIDTHPQNLTITYGANAGFSVAATGTGTLTYQWQVDTTGTGSSFANLSLTGIYANTDSNLTTLEIALPSVSMNGYKYRVVVSGSCSPAATSNVTTLTVNKANATVLISGYTGVYDGTAHGASGTATGVMSEDLSSGLDLGLSFTDVPGGTADWTFTGGTNYNDQNGSVAIVINKADADVSVSGYTGVYDGTAHGASGTATGVMSEDLSSGLDLGLSFTDVPGGTADWTFTGGTNYNDQNGSVAIVINKADADVSVSGYTGVYDGTAHGASGTATGVMSEDLRSGLDLGLSFTDVPGGTANWTFTGGTNYNDQNGSVAIVINKADADVSVSGYTGVYDGTAHGASGTATGVMSEDLSSGLDLGLSFTDVPGGTANWTFTGGTNYNDQNGSVAIVINKADADVSVSGYTGVYDGTAHGASGTATGVMSEDLSSGLDLGLSFTDVPGGTADWTFTGGTNYNDQNGSVAIVINKADADVSVSGYTGVYDGTAHGASGTATGVMSEDLRSGLDLGLSFTDVPGGTANWTFTGGTNYNDQSGSVAIVINKADADVSVNGYTGVYDGNAHGASGTATGVMSEDLSSGLDLGLSFTDVPGGTANWSFEGGTNYNDQSGSVAIVINKADADVSVSGYTGVYDGTAHGASGTATGVMSEDLSSGLDLGLSFTDVPGGTADWTFNGGTNYNNASGSVSISIGAKSITVTAEAKSKIFGDPDPEFTYLLSEILISGNTLNGDLSRAAGESAGNYAINQGGLLVNTGNYSISFVTEDLTIIMPPPMGATVVKTDITCNGANDGTITVTDPAGGLGIYEYRLNTGAWQPSGSFVNLTPGSYNVQMRDPVRTIFSADLGNQIIYEPAVLNAQTTKSNVTCNGTATGSITILNPTGGSGTYEYRLNSDAWQSGPGFSGLAANTYSVSMRDAAHPSCTKNLGSLTVTEPQALSAVCSNSNNLLYFGYTGDQTSTINVKPSGGVGPYKVSITMNRPLKCNVVNTSGDEVWSPGANTASNVNTGCPTSGTPSLLPVSTSSFNINATTGYSLSVTLMNDATFTATITDSNGCVTTCTTTILAEDVRCFSGNSTRPKVNICHKTGSVKNPCVSICVDDNAVAEHIAHGDFLGKCTSNCMDPNGNSKPEEGMVFNVKAYPNPSNSIFNLEIENGSDEEVAIEVFDISGRRIKQLNLADIHGITFGEALPRGVYLVNVQQGSNSKTIRVVKE